MENRRTFLKQTVAAAAGAALLPHGAYLANADENQTPTPCASERRKLGNTGLTLSRLGFGAGTNSGAVQREIGHEEFNKIVRYAYDQGITYFDSAESYQTHTWLKEALKGIPREKLFIQTKLSAWQPITHDEAFSKIEKFLKELGTDYIDSLLIHCQVSPTWNKDMRHIMDAFEKAKEKKMIRVHGISIHSLPAMRTAIEEDWCETMLCRVNPQAHITDSEKGEWNSPGSVAHIPKLIKLLQKASAKGKGIIAMKLIGNGDFKDADDREKAMRFAMNIEEINACVIGFKSIAEIDESIKRMNTALKERVL